MYGALISLTFDLLHRNIIIGVHDMTDRLTSNNLTLRHSDKTPSFSTIVSMVYLVWTQWLC